MNAVNEQCGDNRFEVIQKAKEHLIEATNIESSPDEMKVLDSFLFRAWQMGWLRQYEPTLRNAIDTKVGDKWVSVDERLPEFVKVEKYGDLGNIAKSVRVLCSCLQKDGKQMVKEGYCQRWLDGSGAVWWKIPGTINKVTHWMPLPAPPKGVQ